MRAYYHDIRLHFQRLKTQLAEVEAAMTPPFVVSYMLEGREEDLGKFKTALEVDDAMAIDIARRNGIDLDVVKKVQNAIYRYNITTTAPPF